MLTDLTYTRHLQERVSHMKQLSSLGHMVASLARPGKNLVVEESSLQNLLVQIQNCEVMMLQTLSTMHVTLPEPDLLILANRDAFSSAIGNLIQNA